MKNFVIGMICIGLVFFECYAFEEILDTTYMIFLLTILIITGGVNFGIMGVKIFKYFYENGTNR